MRTSPLAPRSRSSVRSLARFEHVNVLAMFACFQLCELTVGIVGTGANARVLGAMEVLLEHDSDRDVYSYANKVAYESRVRYQLVEGSLGLEAGNVALAVWRGLGCRDAGRVDLRCDSKGVVNFLEINPLAGLNPQHSDLPILCSLVGITYSELIRMILDSACERLSPSSEPNALASGY